MGIVGIASRSLLRLPHIGLFLEPWGQAQPLTAQLPPGGELSAIAGWRGEPQSVKARAKAAAQSIPYLEIRPGMLNWTSGMLWSLTVDSWDAHSGPPAIDRWAAAEPVVSTGLLEIIRRQQLQTTLCRQVLDTPIVEPDGRHIIVIVDEMDGEAALLFTMVEDAHRNHPDARLVVLLPEATVGTKGRLAPVARRHGLDYITTDRNCLGLLRQATRVYTLNSRLGWDALLCGLPVTCFGKPFYAGWGLTDDRAADLLRLRSLSLEQLASWAFDVTGRYVDPVHRRAVSAARIAERLSALRAQAAEDVADTIVLGVSRWKRPFVRPFVAGPHKAVKFAAVSQAVVTRCAQRGARLLVWAAKEPDWLPAAAASAGVPCARIEDGFLRSVGLGSDFIPALSLVVDDLGIYFDPTRESRLERILSETNFTSELRAEADKLHALWVERRLTKYNIAGGARPSLQIDPGRRVILVPGQVEDDASIRLGSPAIRSNLGLLEAVRAAAPDAVILYKPHPDVESGNRPGIVPKAAAQRLVDSILSGWDAHAALDYADEVHTMTSLLGFEALLRGRRVTTYGLPFYAGLGLTTDRLRWPRPRVAASLSALVAATFLLYPRYRDPIHDLPVTAFDVLELLDGMRTAKAGRTTRAGRVRRWISLNFGRR
jgi:capsular polysaccharide export protein